MSLLAVDLYQSATNPEKFLALPAGTDPTVLTGPMVFDQDYSEYGVLGGFPTQRAYYPSPGIHAIAGVEFGF